MTRRLDRQKLPRIIFYLKGPIRSTSFCTRKLIRSGLNGADCLEGDILGKSNNNYIWTGVATC